MRQSLENLVKLVMVTFRNWVNPMSIIDTLFEIDSNSKGWENIFTEERCREVVQGTFKKSLVYSCYHQDWEEVVSEFISHVKSYSKSKSFSDINQAHIFATLLNVYPEHKRLWITDDINGRKELQNLLAALKRFYEDKREAFDVNDPDAKLLVPFMRDFPDQTRSCFSDEQYKVLLDSNDPKKFPSRSVSYDTNSIPKEALCTTPH